MAKDDDGDRSESGSNDSGGRGGGDDDRNDDDGGGRGRGRGRGGDDDGNDDGGRDDDRGGADDGGRTQNRGGDRSSRGDGSGRNDRGVAWVRLSQDDAHRAVSRGEIVPLSRVLRTVESRQKGTVVSVDLLRSTEGRTVYDVVVVERSGDYVRVFVDARTNSVLGTRRR